MQCESLREYLENAVASDWDGILVGACLCPAVAGFLKAVLTVLMHVHVSTSALAYDSCRWTTGSPTGGIRIAFAAVRAAASTWVSVGVLDLDRGWVLRGSDCCTGASSSSTNGNG